MAQSVWIATMQPGLGVKLVDVTGKPQMAAVLGPPIGDAHITKNGVSAIVEATRLANEHGRRIVSATPIDQEIVIIVE